MGASGLTRRSPSVAALGLCVLVVLSVAPIAPSAAPQHRCFGKRATIVGTPHRDRIVGTPGDDVIWGGSGDDRIDGGDGNDRICGGTGNDRLIDGAGADRVGGGGGDDVLRPASGNDALRGGRGLDRIVFAAATSGVTVDLGRRVATGLGTDTVSGIERVVGSGFADVLIGNGRSNALGGAAGDDLIVAGPEDRIWGGDGIDTADYSSAGSGVTVDLASGSVSGAGGAIAGIENVTGTPFADAIRGDPGANSLSGGGGRDALVGREGDDTLFGDDGDDALDGSAGTDRTIGGPGQDTCVGWEEQSECEALFPPVGPVLAVWAPANEGTFGVTRAEAVDIAGRFGAIVALPGTFRDHVAAMKAANPRLILLAYMNGSFAQRDQGSAYPESWYARDADGNKLQSKNFGNWLMDVSNPGWITDRATTCRSLIASTGYDGCMLDMLGTAPLDPGYLTGLPIDPSTGKVWTARDWLDATSDLAATVKVAVAPGIVTGNGLGSGPRYFDPDHPSAVLLRGMDGGLAEAWIRTAGQGIATYRSVSAWKQDVDMLAAAGAGRTPVLTLTKVWVDGTKAEKNAWHEFALASFLLGTDGRSFFSFSYSSSSDPTAGHPWWTLDLGSPTGPYSDAGGYYQRRFTSGLVLVNPGDGTYTVDLDGTYVTVWGKEVTSVTLYPHKGKVLVVA
jgi:hypothetical protein